MKASAKSSAWLRAATSSSLQMPAVQQGFSVVAAAADVFEAHASGVSSAHNAICAAARRQALRPAAPSAGVEPKGKVGALTCWAPAPWGENPVWQRRLGRTHGMSACLHSRLPSLPTDSNVMCTQEDTAQLQQRGTCARHPPMHGLPPAQPHHLRWSLCRYASRLGCASNGRTSSSSSTSQLGYCMWRRRASK